MEPCNSHNLSGLGRYPVAKCHEYRPERRRGVHELLEAAPHDTIIPRGLGRSYGDPAVNPEQGVVNMSRLNRMVAFDPEEGILECEAGVSIAEIVEVFLPRGYFPPVTPGTKFVTVGGAIANDVHGKNHHRDGTFGQHVLDFQLLTPTGEVLTCSREQNADVFWATLGGIGLTGFILTARVRLLPVYSAYMLVDYVRVKDIEEALSVISESEPKYQYSVAWVDCLARGTEMGRAVVMNGDHAVPGDLRHRKHGPYGVPQKRTKSVPIDFPSFALNQYSIAAFNELYYRMHKSKEREVVDFDQYFYPLDHILHWNRMYGKRGFTQYQAAFPFEERQGLIGLLDKLSRSSRASFLAVLKSFGDANEGLLSYPVPGYTLTLDIPVKRGLQEFLEELDQLVLKHHGKLYLAKDMCMARETFDAMYPEADRFREIQARLDPQGKLSSRMARRLGLTKGGE